MEAGKGDTLEQKVLQHKILGEDIRKEKAERALDKAREKAERATTALPPGGEFFDRFIRVGLTAAGPIS